MMSQKWAAAKAQALHDVEERFSHQAARILEGYDLPEHIRLDLQEEHCNDHKVPDDLRLEFINAAFKGNLKILDHEEEFKVQARKESEKFWIEMSAAAKKAQALQDMVERYKQKVIKPSLDIGKCIPEYLKEEIVKDFKIPDNILLDFNNSIEQKFGICNHEKQLKIRAWEESLRFQIKSMADKQSTKKLQALQDMKKKFILDVVDSLKQWRPEHVNEHLIQEHMEYNVSADTQLRFINDIEEKFRRLDYQEELKAHIWEDYKKSNMVLPIFMNLVKALRRCRPGEKKKGKIL